MTDFSYPCLAITAYVEKEHGDLWGVNYDPFSVQMTGGTHRLDSCHYIRNGARATDLPPTETNWQILEPLAISGVLCELCWAAKSVNYWYGSRTGPQDKRDHVHACVCDVDALIALLGDHPVYDQSRALILESELMAIWQYITSVAPTKQFGVVTQIGRGDEDKDGHVNIYTDFVALRNNDNAAVDVDLEILRADGSRVNATVPTGSQPTADMNMPVFHIPAKGATTVDVARYAGAGDLAGDEQTLITNVVNDRAKNEIDIWSREPEGVVL